MGAETVALVALGGGAALNAYGQYNENKLRAEAEEANAAYLESEAWFNMLAAQREVKIYRRESDAIIGQQISAFSKAGVDISGTPLLRLQESKERQAEEIYAIIKDAEHRTELTKSRADQARYMSRVYRSLGYNVMTVGGPLLVGAGNVAASQR